MDRITVSALLTAVSIPLIVVGIIGTALTLFPYLWMLPHWLLFLGCLVLGPTLHCAARRIWWPGRGQSSEWKDKP